MPTGTPWPQTRAALLSEGRVIFLRLKPVDSTGTALTRFNALRHSVLSRYTVLPWEDPEEYLALVAALVAEHAPQGLTEEHLVEELAGILWRKRRLRLAEAAAHRRGLHGTFASYRETVTMALVHTADAGQSEHITAVPPLKRALIALRGRFEAADSP